MSAMLPVKARELAASPTELSADDLATAWKSIAGIISYLHADDSGSDWRDVPLWRPSLDALEAEHDRRKLDRPSRAGFLL